MQHAQLVTGIKKVIDALRGSGLRDALAPVNIDDTGLMLDSLRKYAIAASSYTSAETTVADLLGLSELDSSTAWTKLLSGGPARAHYYDRVGFVTHHLPQFVELLEESAVLPPTGSHTMCVTVIDADRGLATPRLLTIINSLSKLYRSCADLHSKQVEDLRLVSLDGGDDTLLWFEGDAQAIHWSKELLKSAFRWLALYREHDEIQERIQLAKDNLPTIQVIHDLAARGNLNADEASEIEHVVLVGLLAFFDAGAIIPEMEQDLHQSVREVVNSSRPPGVVVSGNAALDAVMSEIENLDENDADVSLVGEDEPPEDDGLSEHEIGEEAIIELEPGAVEISD
jgi:hypothetical protein